ncbi:MAG: DAK2 domain-containing protein [Microthrixaceae bacterium]
MAEPIESLSASGWHDALADASRVLADHASALDEMDGHGVGTDLAATLSAAVSAVDQATDFASLSTALARGASESANTAAGRHLATVLAGMGDSLTNADSLDGERFAIALEGAAEKLAQSHDGRRPGRFAAVVSEAADAALAVCDRGAPLPDVVIAAASGGIEELERGPETDPVLAERGTVDPAGAGMLLVLDALASIAAGEPLPERPVVRSERSAEVAAEVLRYEVSCRVIPDVGGVELAASLEDVLRELGELVQWDTAGDSCSLAVHTPLPGAAVEAIVELGRPREMRIALFVGGDGTGPIRGSSAEPSALAGVLG